MVYANRQSTAVRASVYDAFAELGGLDSNSKVAQWMFSPGDALTEEDETGDDAPRGSYRAPRRQLPSRGVSFPDVPVPAARPATSPSQSSERPTSPSRGLRSFLSIRFLTRRSKPRKPLARSRSSTPASRSRDDSDLPGPQPRRPNAGARSRSAVDVRAMPASASSSRQTSTDTERVPRLVRNESRSPSEDSVLTTPLSSPPPPPLGHLRHGTMDSWDAVDRRSVTLEDMQKRNPFLHGSRLAEML